MSKFRDIGSGSVKVQRKKENGFCSEHEQVSEAIIISRKSTYFLVICIFVIIVIINDLHSCDLYICNYCYNK